MRGVNDCGLINTRPMSNKAASIIELFISQKMDILVITETWLYSDDSAKLRKITPPGYQIISNPRDSRRGGGVAVICRENYKCKMKTPTDFESFEFLQLELISGNQKSYIFAVYRPVPNAASIKQFFCEFTNFLEITCVVPNEILILGDFNIHLDIPQLKCAPQDFIKISQIFVEIWTHLFL